MQIAKHVVRNHLIPKSHTVLGSTPKASTRGMAAMHGGRLRKNGNPITDTQGTQPESDLIGKHGLVLSAGCSKKGCRDQNCATGTQLSTGKTQQNPCNESTTYHQQTPKQHPDITYELAGNTTTTLPPNKKGIEVDPHNQVNGQQKPQQMVTEPYTVPISPVDWKENNTSTIYVQKDNHTKAIVNGMPSDSILNQK